MKIGRVAQSNTSEKSTLKENLLRADKTLLEVCGSNPTKTWTTVQVPQQLRGGEERFLSNLQSLECMDFSLEGQIATRANKDSAWSLWHHLPLTWAGCGGLLLPWRGHIMEGLRAGGCKKGNKQENMLGLINSSLLFCFEAFVHCLNYSVCYSAPCGQIWGHLGSSSKCRWLSPSV